MNKNQALYLRAMKEVIDLEKNKMNFDLDSCYEHIQKLTKLSVSMTVKYIEMSLDEKLEVNKIADTYFLK